MEKKHRLAKILAQRGVASRRQAEELIRQGAVAVAGVTITNVAHCIMGDEPISVHGRPTFSAPATQVWAFHKPAGYLCTARDPQGRPTVFEILPKKMPRVVSVGRLDFNSEGLLLLTTDGALAQQLMRSDAPRTYRVRAFGGLSADQVAAAAAGLTIEGVRYKPITIDLPDRATEGKNQWYIVTLHEGKNREIRRVFEHFGCTVNRLVRLAYGPISLGSLPTGKTRLLSAAEVEQL